MNLWGSAEWWLFFTIVLLFAVYAVVGVCQAAPDWLQRLRSLERGRRSQANTRDHVQDEWYASRRSAAREWLDLFYPETK
jgi:hypothetical protein